MRALIFAVLLAIVAHSITVDYVHLAYVGCVLIKKSK